MKENIFYGEKSSVINPSTEPFGVIVGHFGYERTLPTKEVVTSEGYHTFRLHYIVKGSVFYSYNGKEKGSKGTRVSYFLRNRFLTTKQIRRTPQLFSGRHTAAWKRCGLPN